MNNSIDNIISFPKKRSVNIKSINPLCEVDEPKYIKQIIDSLIVTPSQEAIKQNKNALEMLRKARRR